MKFSKVLDQVISQHIYNNSKNPEFCRFGPDIRPRGMADEEEQRSS